MADRIGSFRHERCVPCAERYSTFEPGLHVLLDPTDAVIGNFHSHRKRSLRLKLIERGLAQARYLPNLRQTQNPDGISADRGEIV